MPVDIFSTRNSCVNVDDAIQVGTINKELKNGLWNVFCETLKHGTDNGLNQFLYSLFKEVLKEPVDTIPYSNKFNFIRIKFFDSEWYFIYDLIEFTIRFFQKYPSFYFPKPPNSYAIDNSHYFVNQVNDVLELENSGYRIVDGKVVPITNEIEMDTVKEALSCPFAKVKTHIDNALSKLSDRKNPDYRNSIKESISAVECILREITNENTLGKAIKNLKNCGIIIPSLLRESMEKLYAYTNGKDGIRHALMEEPNLTLAEVKYVLVTCSAFVNYIIKKKSMLTLPSA